MCGCEASNTTHLFITAWGLMCRERRVERKREMYNDRPGWGDGGTRGKEKEITLNVQTK